MKYKLGFLGVGKMGGAILEGIIHSNLYGKKDILLCVKTVEHQNILNKNGYDTVDNIDDLLKKVDLLFLAIKPQTFNEIVFTHNNSITVVSMMAGITSKRIEEKIGTNKIIRVMPNTPSIINYGTTALSKTESIHNEVDDVIEIFKSIGAVYMIDEEKMANVIPLNGSMPAYLYYFAKPFIEEAIKAGIEEEIAKKICCDAIIGSALMIKKQNKSIDELINDVCSKGGTTLAGLEVLKDNKIADIIKKASQACVKRAIELSK